MLKDVQMLFLCSPHNPTGVLYKKEDIEGTLVLGAVNFPPKQIGPFISEVLTLGVPDEQGRVVLVRPDKDAKIGGKLF